MKKSTRWQRLTQQTEFYIFLVLIVAIVVIQIMSGGQLSEPNQIVTILRAMIVDGLLGMACLIVIISGGFDLSFPTVAAFSSCLARISISIYFLSISAYFPCYLYFFC